MFVGPLMPAGVQTLPAPVWFVPDPVTPVLLSQHPRGPCSILVRLTQHHRSLQLPRPSPAGSHSWMWRMYSQVSRDAGDKTVPQQG